jgi:uncharacterized membrane protein YphA (DoxX/SURF4 family)
MSIFFKARGSSSFGLFLLRLALGLYTLILGIQQAGNIEGYINKVKAFGMIDPNAAFIIGFIMPFLLILLGSLYIMGFFTPVTSLALALIMIFKIAVRGIFPTPGVPFNKDIIFLAGFLTTLFAGAGIISFDAFLDRKKKVKVVPAAVEKKEVIKTEIVETPVNRPNLDKPITGDPIPPAPPPEIKQP